MRKLKLYLDTSIFNFAISDQVPDYKEVTLRLLETVKAGRYEGYISEVVMREINAAGEKKAAELNGVVNDLILEELEINAEIEELSERYIQEGLIPVKYSNDALHLAVASYYELDAIVTWNFEHLVKLKTKKGVISVNTLAGYKPLDIINPLEVI